MKNIIIFISLYLLFNIGTAKVLDTLSNNNTNNEKGITNLNAVQTAFNTSSATANIKTCYYSKDTICKIRIRERMPTIIKLPAKITSWVLGDSRNFKAVILNKENNLLSLSAIFAGIDTNLTLITADNQLFPFYIRVDSIKSDYLSDFVVRVVDTTILKDLPQELKIVNADNKKLDKQIDKLHKQITQEYLSKKPEIKAENINFNYQINSKNKTLLPKAIFDDGFWTYFKYGDNKDMTAVTKLPVIYKVIDGYDTPVNSRIEGVNLIVESISNKWTIRAGELYACVRKKDN